VAVMLGPRCAFLVPAFGQSVRTIRIAVDVTRSAALWPAVYFNILGECPSSVAVVPQAAYTEWIRDHRSTPSVLTGLSDGVLVVAIDEATRTVSLSVSGTVLMTERGPNLAAGTVLVCAFENVTLSIL
jgi:hypothetical protein